MANIMYQQKMYLWVRCAYLGVIGSFDRFLFGKFAPNNQELRWHMRIRHECCSMVSLNVTVINWPLTSFGVVPCLGLFAEIENKQQDEKGTYLYITPNRAGSTWFRGSSTWQLVFKLIHYSPVNQTRHVVPEQHTDDQHTHCSRARW